MGFYRHLEANATHYAIVARLTQAFKRLLSGLRYQFVNKPWEMAELEYRPHDRPKARRYVVARRFIPDEDTLTTLFTLGRYAYRAWVTNMNLTPAGIWHFYDGRAGMEPRIGELRADFALRKLRYKLFFLPAELTRPQNRPILRLKESPLLRELTGETLDKIRKLKPLHA